MSLAVCELRINFWLCSHSPWILSVSHSHERWSSWDDRHPDLSGNICAAAEYEIFSSSSRTFLQAIWELDCLFLQPNLNTQNAQTFVLSGKLEMGRGEQEMKFPESKEVGVLRAWKRNSSMISCCRCCCLLLFLPKAWIYEQSSASDLLLLLLFLVFAGDFFAHH